MSNMTPIEAAALIAADKERRVQAAAEAVQAALREHECDLVAVPQVTPDGRIVAVVQIVAR
jgi:pyruvate/2-oxoglutarate dehydrogenase complex dihydrolipoamide acyltransferase (E2) component